LRKGRFSESNRIYLVTPVTHRPSQAGLDVKRFPELPAPCLVLVYLGGRMINVFGFVAMAGLWFGRRFFAAGAPLLRLGL